MSCVYWNIHGHLTPIAGKGKDLFRAILDEGMSPSLNADGSLEFYYSGDGGYCAEDSLMDSIQGLSMSGTVSVECDDGGECHWSAMHVFSDGKDRLILEQTFSYYDGFDDSLAFAKKLPDSVIQAILSHAEEFHHD